MSNIHIAKSSSTVLKRMLKLIMRNTFPFCKQIIEKLPHPAESQSSMVRLSKWISMKSICSRKEAEEIIKLGLVRIDGKRVYDNLMVPDHADVKAFTMQGVQVQRPITRLWMLNKPRGYICSHNDPQKRPSIYQLLPPGFKSFGFIQSVGRLDFNSEGLLLLTNDVELKNLLQNPVTNLTRLYRVKVHGRVTPDKLEKMTKPMTISGQTYGPLQVTVDRALTTNVWLNIALKTGKNREVRKIMQKCDLQVNKLVRLEYGKYKLGGLEAGAVKELPITDGLERRLKVQKVKQISNNKSCLIEIDIREKALEMANEQYKKRLEGQKVQSIENKQDKSEKKTPRIKEEKVNAGEKQQN